MKGSWVQVPSGPLEHGETMKEKTEINIKNHSFVPKFIKLSEKEKEKILSDYNISSRQLPRILIKDSAIQDLEELKEGDVIKIIRNSPTAGESNYYRIVTNG